MAPSLNFRHAVVSLLLLSLGICWQVDVLAAYEKPTLPSTASDITGNHEHHAGDNLIAGLICNVAPTGEQVAEQNDLPKGYPAYPLDDLPWFKESYQTQPLTAVISDFKFPPLYLSTERFRL